MSKPESFDLIRKANVQPNDLANALEKEWSSAIDRDLNWEEGGLALKVFANLLLSEHQAGDNRLHDLQQRARREMGATSHPLIDVLAWAVSPADVAPTKNA